ncbi:LysR family transcriptional regulator [Staphylococcus sp. GDY8P38P]|uniref:LysR family transcriptional regulator n=1 Tax=Staphylococcus sp. GDY8P38P TaxID=2804116 RepID=UPI001AEC46B6|nr:LysR family transcriptional regulator [Staphylococcus sp. GDY8P38P]
MEIKDFKIFQSVSQHQSISKAAKSLNYVQSHVTFRIKQLEQELNTQLFLRHNKGTTLTKDGEKFQIYVEKILATLNEIEHDFDKQETSSGKIDIGIVETITKLPMLLSMFRKNSPHVSLSLHTDVTANISKKIVNQNLDCGFVTGFKHHHHINKVELFKEKLVLISGTEMTQLEDITSAVFLVFKNGCNYRRNLEAWLKSENTKKPTLIEFGTMETIIGSVKSGIGISLIPKSSVQNDLENGSLYSYELPDKYSNISTDFIWNRNYHLSLAMTHFIQTIKSFAYQY